MRLQSGSISAEFAPDLVEEALIAAARSAEPSERMQFLEEREAVSSIEIVDIREESFRELDAHWAERFRVGDPLFSAIEQTGLFARGLSGCFVDRACAGTEERAELRSPGEDGSPRVLRLTVKGETLLSPDRLRELIATNI